MQLSKAFVVTMGAILVFLLSAFATEDGRCIARARRALQDILPASSADLGTGRVAAEWPSHPDSIALLASCETPSPPVNVRTRTPFGRQGIPLRPSLLAGDFNTEMTLTR